MTEIKTFFIIMYSLFKLIIKVCNKYGFTGNFNDYHREREKLQFLIHEMNAKIDNNNRNEEKGVKANGK